MLEQPAATHHPYRGRPSEDELPDLQGWEWRLFDPLRYECGTSAVTAWRKPLDESEPLPGEDRFAFVVANAAEYLLAHGVREIDVPQYYSRFHDEFEPVVSSWTIARHGRALGVDTTLLEATVRLADGDGRIDHDALSIYLCENDTLLAFGSRGAFLVDVCPLKHSDVDREPSESAHVDIGRFAIPEADPNFQRGLRRFIDIFDEHAPATLSRYKYISDGKHVFETESGRDVYAGSPLRQLSRMVVDETELRRVHTYDLDGDTYQSDWNEHTASHALGDETRLGVVVGFEHRWNEKEYIMSGGIHELQSQAHYWCFRPQPEKYDYYDFQVMSIDEDIDTFRPSSGE